MAMLRTLKGLNPGQLFPLEGKTAVLGRHPDCNIVLEVGAVSRQHAQIVNGDGGYYIEDLRSRNGTFLNDELVSGRQLLNENDRIRICDVVFVFHQGPVDAATVSAEVFDAGGQPAMLVDDNVGAASSTLMSKLDISSGSTGLRLAVNAEVKLKALVEIGQHLGKALGLNEVLPKLLESLFAIFAQADRGFIVLKNLNSGRLVPMAVKHRREDDSMTIRISRTIVNEVMSSREAILSADAATDSRFDMAESIVDFQIRSMMCAPLVGMEGDALGVIQIDSLDQRKRFSQDDLDVLASVASQVGYAVENAQLHEAALVQQALERELAVAHEVQQGLLPDAPPELEGYGFFHVYLPANQLGGDFFDYVRLPDGRLAVVLADVSGKGISAALLVAKLSAVSRNCLLGEPTPAAAVVRMNNVFCESRWEDRFITLVLCVVDVARHKVTVVNAGHMAPLLRRESGAVEEVDQAISGLPVGVDTDFPYEQAEITLGAGDCLTLYTDGVTEAMNSNGDLYGNERLLPQLEPAAESVTALGKRILADVRRFVGNRAQSDDLCMVCFGREGGGE